MITIAQLIEHRRRTERLIERGTAARLPTEYGEWSAVGYRSILDGKHHLALVKGEVDGRPRRAGARPLGVPHRATSSAPSAATAASSCGPRCA